MSFNTLYGINGVGKDTVANRLKQDYDHTMTITSMSRLSMYLLGITDHYDAQRKVSTEAYAELEQVPQPEMVELEEGACRDFIHDLAQSDQNTLMLSHLVFALHVGHREPVYLTDRRIPDWYIQENSGIVQLQAEPETIISRRLRDLEDEAVQRVRPTALEQVKTHQTLCDTEWNRLLSRPIVIPKGLHIVENHDLDDTVNKVGEILYG